MATSTASARRASRNHRKVTVYDMATGAVLRETTSAQEIKRARAIADARLASDEITQAQHNGIVKAHKRAFVALFGRDEWRTLADTNHDAQDDEIVTRTIGRTDTVTRDYEGVWTDEMRDALYGF